jgi:hypothetical protein
MYADRFMYSWSCSRSWLSLRHRAQNAVHVTSCGRSGSRVSPCKTLCVDCQFVTCRTSAAAPPLGRRHLLEPRGTTGRLHHRESVPTTPHRLLLALLGLGGGGGRLGGPQLVKPACSSEHARGVSRASCRCAAWHSRSLSIRRHRPGIGQGHRPAQTWWWGAILASGRWSWSRHTSIQPSFHAMALDQNNNWWKVAGVLLWDRRRHGIISICRRLDVVSPLCRGATVHG